MYGLLLVRFLPFFIRIYEISCTYLLFRGRLPEVMVGIMEEEEVERAEAEDDAVALANAT